MNLNRASIPLLALLAGLTMHVQGKGAREQPGASAGCEARRPAVRSVVVSSVGALQEALADARPGDRIEVADGTYETTERLRINRSGTAEEPIVVRARNRGGAVIAGRYGFAFDSAAYVLLEGFKLIHSNESKACELKNCHHVRVTRNHFRLTEDTDRQMHWVYITGESHHNRVDHNLFEEKHRTGNFISLHGVSKSDQPTGRPSQYDRIDHNHFRNIGPRVRNGMEAIRLGNSKMSVSSAYCTVEQNLFENCDGDPEFISVKCSDNIIRYNTCLNSHGSVVLRHGNRCVAEGNFFFCTDGKPGVGGIRIYGDDQRVINNYFQGLTGKGDEAPLVLCNGDTDTGPLDARFRPHRAVIAFNTFVNCVNTTIDMGFDDADTMDLPSRDCTIANNI
ncbi:MAG: polysaccharide lyase 6 family protein, partial [Armatimonadota bacterium]